MAKFKQKMGICSYCGNHAVVTEDHVIPRSLFAGPMPSHPRPPKVLACPDCNNVMKSSDDTLLRDLLAADIVSQSHPDAQTNFANVRKAARANKSEFARYVSGSNRLISMFSKGGIFLGSAYEIKLPSGRVVQVLSNITRGLYAFYVANQHHPRLPPLPKDTEFTVRRWYDVSELEDMLIAFNHLGAPKVGIGDGSVFDCRYIVDPQEPTWSIWILRFYSNAFFSIGTNLALKSSNAGDS